ncbi:hypothetical protein [Streptomyces sp. NPDC005760]|uniref:hypothetical protein n=1 Tax=Streptomyces sp. NPDC005760 TaxID=3156718 RepID=UPI00340EEC63
MAPRPLKAVLTVAATVAFSLTAVPAQAADPDPFVWTELTTAYTETGPYGYEPFASSDGYVRTDECVPHVGYRYVNAAYTGSLDPGEPSALLYEDGPRGRELTAVEWAVADTGQAAPELFGQKFDEGQQPNQFTLRAWIYKKNPSGFFHPTHPDVTCGSAADPSTPPEAGLLADIDWTGLVT